MSMYKESNGNSDNTRSDTNDLNLLCAAALGSGAAPKDTITGASRSQAYKGGKRKRKGNSTGSDDIEDIEGQGSGGVNGVNAAKGAAVDEDVVLNVNPGDVLASLPKQGGLTNYFIVGDSRFESVWNDDSIFRLEARCIDNKAYLFVSDHDKGEWYHYQNIHVKGKLPPLTCQRLYRVLAHGDGGCQFLNRIYGDMCVVNKMSDCMFLCDSIGHITSRGKLLSTTVDTFMKFFISSENYFEPIPFGVQNLFDVISAYAMMDDSVMAEWQDQVTSANRSEHVLTTLIESCKASLPRTMDTTKSDWWLSVVAHAVAFNRLLDAWNVSKPAKANNIAIKCICCADASDRVEEKGIVDRYQNVNAILYGSGFEIPFQTADAKGGKDSAYAGHCPILSPEKIVKVKSFLDKMKFLNKAEFDDKKYFGVCATLYALHVVLRYYLKGNGILSDVLSTITSEVKSKEDEADLKDAMTSLTKRGTRFETQFEGSIGSVIFARNTTIVTDFATTIAGIMKDGYPVGLAIEKAYSSFLAVQNKTLDDNEVLSHLEKVKDLVLECGEKVAVVDSVRLRVTSKSSFLLYSILLQLGVLQRYFYGPLLPILAREKGMDWVNRNVGGDIDVTSQCNFQVAVAPAAEGKLLELVTGLNIKADFIKISDEPQDIDLSPCEEILKAVIICPNEATDFESKAADVLLAKRRNTSVSYAAVGGECASEEEGHKSDDESTAFSLSR